MTCGINWQNIVSGLSSPVQLEKIATMIVLPSSLPSSFWSRNFKYVLQQITCSQLQWCRHIDMYINWYVHHQSGWSGRTFQSSYCYVCLGLCNCKPFVFVIVLLMSHCVSKYVYLPYTNHNRGIWVTNRIILDLLEQRKNVFLKTIWLQRNTKVIVPDILVTIIFSQFHFSSFFCLGIWMHLQREGKMKNISAILRLHI